MSFVEGWGNLPRNALLDFLGDHVGSDYSITELAEKGGFSRPTVYAAILDLVKNDLIMETRKLGRSRLFTINIENPLIQAVLTKDFERARSTAEARRASRSGARRPVSIRQP